MTRGVLLEGLQVVEAHGLLVEDGYVELQGVVVLEPGHVVGRYPEGEGVGLGEHVLAVELLEDPLRGLWRYATIHGPLEEPLPVLLDEALVVLAREGPPELVGLGGGEARHVHGHLVHLVLEQDYAQGPLQGPALQGMVVLPVCALGVAPDELGDPVV